jgi:hypothetical protein
LPGVTMASATLLSSARFIAVSLNQTPEITRRRF